MTNVESSTSAIRAIYRGVIPWDVVRPFPMQDPADRLVGDRRCAELSTMLTERVDPQTLDEKGQLPDGLLDALIAGGFMSLRVEPSLGGLGLSNLNAFRCVQTAASWAVPVGTMMGIQTGLGAGAYLPLIPPGPLRDLIEHQVAARTIFCDADTEPMGAANRWRATRAEPTADGAAYAITGSKAFIGNGPVAGLMAVAASVNESGHDSVRIFFVEAPAPGFSVTMTHELMGLRGLPIGALSFDRVRVPRDHMLVMHDDQWRLSTELTAVWTLGRFYSIAAPSLAIAKRCVTWMREFIQRRNVDHQPLGSYDEIQRLVSASVADLYALDSVVRWCLLGSNGKGGFDLRLDQQAAKNITSRLCWRIADRTMSILAAEGYETVASKRQRGVPAHPVERAFRDARALRISGGVDFFIAKWAAQTRIFPEYYGPAPPRLRAAAPDDRLGAEATWLAGEAFHLAETCNALAGAHPNPDALFAKQHLLIALNRIADELLTSTLVVARTTTSESAPSGQADRLSRLYCAGARQRLASLWGDLETTDAPEPAMITDALIRGEIAGIVGDLVDTHTASVPT